ncbi:UDP-glucosyltransferase 2-like isoform X1 [Danaus plexippus]|uniref:UDP-glucosyltransferase 2-like isoform X1 n=1 Tax=Danaus plexippus TaxID=13037 RepID=UPI002AB2824E|nr:UDP-glucosyltransferase 2-like isoform X1 [Danaus plexippus]
MILTKIIILSFLSLPNDVYCARILGLFPHPGKSHFMVFEPLLKRLSELGHHVTVASFFPPENPPANYTHIKFDGAGEPRLDILDLKTNDNVNFVRRIPILGGIIQQMSDFNLLAELALTKCQQIIEFQPLANVLKEDYDLVFIEIFNSDCAQGLIHQYGIKAPIVGLSSCTITPWTAYRIGVSDNPAYVPVVGTTHTPTMSLLQRMENTFMLLYHNLWYRYKVQVKEQAIIENYFGRKMADLDLLSRNISLLLVNTFHPLNGVKPLVPGVVEIGGIHLNPNKKSIPGYIERFLNESKHGVILLSFGSLIKTSTIPKYKEEIIVNTLSKFKQRVIWKYEESEPEGTLVGNILKVRWLPQFELLQHEKVVAFIAHGGLLGMTESVYSGKPMVVVPFFGDQPSNAAAAANAGFAKIISYIDMTEKDLGDAVRSVLSEEMQLNARRVSKMWQDRESAPLDTAVYWTERVLRWGHSGKLHTAARDLSLYELALIDVFAAYALALTVILLSVWFILTKLMRLIIKESKQKIH